MIVMTLKKRVKYTYNKAYKVHKDGTVEVIKPIETKNKEGGSSS